MDTRVSWLKKNVDTWLVVCAVCVGLYLYVGLCLYIDIYVLTYVCVSVYICVWESVRKEKRSQEEFM